MPYYFFYDSTGAIKEVHQYTEPTTWTPTPPNVTILEAPDTNATAQDAFAWPMRYTVVSGVLTQVSTYSTMALHVAQSAQIAGLENSFANALNAGFVSTADTTSRTYALNPLAYQRISGYLSLVNAGKAPTSITWHDVSNNTTSLTPTEFIQLASDAFAFYDNAYTHLQTQIASVQSATTISAVQAVTW